MDTSVEMRSLIVQQALKEKKSVREVLRTLNIPRSTVKNVLHVYSQTGSLKTRRQGRCGRPPAMTEYDKRALLRKSQADPQATSRQLRASCPSNVIRLSLSTIKNVLRQGGRLAYRPVASPRLTASQRKVRLNWCKAHATWTEAQWSQVQNSPIPHIS